MHALASAGSEFYCSLGADASGVAWQRSAARQLQAKWRRLIGTIKYANDATRGFLADTTRLWLQLEYLW
jgi:hypothetical protein